MVTKWIELENQMVHYTQAVNYPRDQCLSHAEIWIDTHCFGLIEKTRPLNILAPLIAESCDALQ